MKLLKIVKSPNGMKRYRATFLVNDSTKHIDFGDPNSQNYTIHHDEERREHYLNRHRSREDWNNPMTAGALSRWILWGPSTSLTANITAFKTKFHL